MSPSATVITTKVETPPIPATHVRRQRLLDAVSRGVATHPLTLLSAPPGAGKTTLAAAWAHSGMSPWPVAWLNIDRREDAAGPFWSYVVDALSRVGITLPGAGHPSRHIGVDRDFVIRLIADLQNIPTPVVLILDQDDPLTHPQVVDDLDFLLHHTFNRLRIVLSARADPRLPVHRYRVTDRVTEIRSDALAFSQDEAAELFASHGVTLAHETVKVLWERTEGWAAGLQLAAVTLAKADDRESAAAWLETSDDYVSEYLTAEVLAPQDPDVRRLLLRTSVADRLWPSLADVLTDRTDGTKMLPILARENLFIGRDPREPGAYRVHPLFRRILRLELATQAAAEVPRLHLLTARWLAARGDLEGAVQHSIDAGNWPAAIGLLVDNLAISHLLVPSLPNSYVAAFRRMPGGLSGPLPEIVLSALTLGAGDIDAAVVHSAKAQVKMADAPTSPAALVAIGLVHTALSAATGDSARTLDSVARTQDVLSRVDTDRVDHHDVVVLLLAYRGRGLLWAGRETEAVAALEKAASASGHLSYLRLACLADVALVEALRGRLRRASELATAVHLAAEEAGLASGGRPPAAAIALAWVYHQRCDSARTRRWTRAAREALAGSSAEPLSPLVCLLEAFDLAARGAVERADAIRHGLIHRPGPSPWVHGHVLAELGQREASAWRVVDGSQTVEPAFSHAADDRPRHAPPSVDGPSSSEDMRRFPAARLSVIEQVRAHLSRAAEHLEHDEPSLAVHATSRALHVARPESLRRPLLGAPPQLQPLLRAASARPPRVHRRSTATSQTSHDAPLLEPLTSREAEVLQHLSAMLSTGEIATAMFISVNTVRTHVRSILRKLDVNRRNEAVRRARLLKLI